MSISFTWRNWHLLRAVMDARAVREYLVAVGKASEAAMRRGSAAAGGGPVYRGSRRSASLPGQYPAIQTGGLINSLKSRVGGNTLEVSVETPYAQYLLGTRKMAPRKLVDDALVEGMRDVSEARYARHFAYFTYGGRKLR